MIHVKDNERSLETWINVFIFIRHYRAHTGPVLALTVSPNGDLCFSGGVDTTIRCWNMPSSNIDPYDSFGKNINTHHTGVNITKSLGGSFTGDKLIGSLPHAFLTCVYCCVFKEITLVGSNQRTCVR